MLALLAVVLGLALPVPYVPQVKDGCGAAALAMVLRHWGLEADGTAIAVELRARELRGIQGSRLAAFAQARGLTAVAYAGDLDNLRAYLSKGRPLIVAWKMGRGRYHNVVVVGIDEERGRVMVHDPAVGASRAVALDLFAARWAGAGHWTLLVLPRAA